MRPTAFVIVVVAALMVAVPAVALIGGERPDRYGWHMFAASKPLPQVVAVTPSGRVDVSLSELFARPRPEIDLYAVVPPAVCDRHADATTVVMTSRDGRRKETTAC